MEVKYEKHYILSNFGEENQKIIQNTKILIVGIGGIGCQVLTQLALNGFENIGLCEYDIVNTSNLHRQFIYTLEDAENKREKIECAEKYILERNNINISKYSLKISNKNVNKIIKDYSIIIDCTDNMYTRYVLNDACVLSNKVYVFASAIQTSCQFSIFDNKKEFLSKNLDNFEVEERKNKLPCLRCIFPSIENETCENQGVLGTIPNLVGMLTANELIKYVCNLGESLVGKLLTYNTNTGFYTINIDKKNPKCLLCGPMQIINKDNFESLSIYDEICNYENKNYSITREKILELDPSFHLIGDIIYLNDKVSLTEYENIYINIINATNNLINNNENNIINSNIKNGLLVFNCANKIRSKILVHKLREKINSNNRYFSKIFYLL